MVEHQGLIDRMEDLIFWNTSDFEVNTPKSVKEITKTPGTLFQTTEYLKSSQVSLLKAVIQFAKFKDDESPGILSRIDDWKQVTVQDLKHYHSQHTSVSGIINSTSNQSMDLVELQNFSKSIKRDSSAFPKLQNDKYFDPFSRTFIIIAEQQSCSEILDPNYIPSSDPAAKSLFKKKNSYMYSVMHQCLLTDKGKFLTRKYATTYDAQKVWKEFVHHIKRSSKGEQAKAELHE